MKTIFKILLVIGFLSYFAQNAKAEDTLNPCWRMYKPHDPDHNSFNPDSVMWDTCVTGDHKVLYAYKWFYVILPVGALNVPWAPRDSLIYRDWRDIDTNFTELRDGFQMIENKFTPFIMKKQIPDDIDTSSLGSRSWYVKFEEYFNIDSVVYYMNYIYDLYAATYDMRAYRLADNVNDDNSENQNTINIYPNPAIDFIKIEFQNQFNARKIQIISLEGVIILETEYKEEIDISNLQTGLYFIKYGNTIRNFIVYH